MFLAWMLWDRLVPSSHLTEQHEEGKIMFSRRNVVLLSLVIFALTAWEGALHADGEFLTRLRARHVKETVFVSAGNRRLAGFFDGVVPHPHWDARKALQAARNVPRCDANRAGGLLVRLAGLFDRTVYAQGCAVQSVCGGNWGATTTASCGTDCGDVNIFGSGGQDFCTGTEQDGGNCGYCSTTCNLVTCGIPNCTGGCLLKDEYCEDDSQCCSGSCDGYCVNIF
jgi:hypothetical protein